MKVAIVYNRDSNRVINLFGIPNREKYGMKSIRRITDALRKGGHQVKSFEGDKDLVDNLEHFMPRVMKGELPGMVFNISYGIQGQARYTHVPSILEMVGIPYVGSGPLAHSLALDKVVAKMLFQQHGLPTPEYTVLDSPDFSIPDLQYPLIVKPKNEAVSFGIQIVNSDDELHDAALIIFDKFQQPVLVERYIEGREINVGILGNGNPEIFAPVELIFGEGGPNIYTMEDKKRISGREVGYQCPAPISQDIAAKAQEISLQAFKALGCYDCARIDMRLDAEGNLYILEINSLPSLGEHGSYLVGAEQAGLNFKAVVNRLVEVANARYFGSPEPPPLTRRKEKLDSAIFSFITQRRDRIEDRLARWIRFNSRTENLVGIRNAQREMNSVFIDVKMKLVEDLSDDPIVWTWETNAGLNGGTLIIAHLDVPLKAIEPIQPFRRDPELLFGEGIGSSRGPLVEIEFALRALQFARSLTKRRLGVLLYSDEGLECRYSSDLIDNAIRRATRVIVIRPIIQEDSIIVERRGQRLYHFVVEGKGRRIDKNVKKDDAFRWGSAKLAAFSNLSLSEKRLSIAAVDVHTQSFPMQLPHRLEASVIMNYIRRQNADDAEKKMRAILQQREFNAELELVSDRPPMINTRLVSKMAKDILQLAESWDIPLTEQSSAVPSVAGMAPSSIPVMCGMGPICNNLYTPNESISRISLLQRTLLLAQYLAVKRVKYMTDNGFLQTAEYLDTPHEEMYPQKIAVSYPRDGYDGAPLRDGNRLRCS